MATIVQGTLARREKCREGLGDSAISLPKHPDLKSELRDNPDLCLAFTSALTDKVKECCSFHVAALFHPTGHC